MQGLVTLDFGNSNPHAGIFQKHGEWKLIKVVPWNELGLHLSNLGISPHNSQLVLSEVKAREEELAPLLQQGYLLTRVKDYWRGKKFAGMPVDYAETLGEDRLITAYYCFKKLKEPMLLIDAGTFVTIDVITADGFMGGYIAPGISAYNSTFQKGEQLKAVELKNDPKSTLPHTTLEAMQDSYSAFAALALKLVEEHQLRKILITGGSRDLWKGLFGSVKTTAVVETNPDLIHWALQFWMTTQIEPL